MSLLSSLSSGILKWFLCQLESSSMIPFTDLYSTSISNASRTAKELFIKAASQIISCTGPIPILQLLHLYVWFWYVVDRMGYYTSIDQYNICQDALFQDSRRVSISALMCTMLYCTVCRYNIVLYWTDW